MTIRTTAMLDAKRTVGQSVHIPIGQQGIYATAGLWEIAQTPNSNWETTETLDQWGTISAVTSINALPERTLAVQMYGVTGGVDYSDVGVDNPQFRVSSYWDTAGTLLADTSYFSYRSELPIWGSWTLFCPITAYASNGIGAEGNDTPNSQFTLRLERTPAKDSGGSNAFIFTDMVMQRIYLPSDGDLDYANK